MAMPHAELAQDEAFWATIRGKYKLTPEYINLENGYYSMQAEPVLEAFIGHVRSINVQASRYMRTRQPDDKLRVRTRLAKMAGVSPEELIITRNTTESLDTVISGYDWKPGDEAVMAAQDYGAMLDMFKLQARRHGIVNRVVSLPLDPQSDDELVQLYASAITPKTRLLMVGHMVNITGHILPVRKIADMAHARGVDVMCDGAHAFGPARVPHPRPRLRLLRSVAPQMVRHAARRRHPVRASGQDRGALADLRGREHGRHRHPEAESHRDAPGAHDLGIDDAIDFHESIGAERKEARLRYVQRYWTSRVRDVPNILVNTPTDPKRSCAIANVGVRGMTPADLAKTLFERYKVFTVAIDTANVHGVRVTPQLFTTPKELDVLVRALKELAAAA
jgi:selenocysteine lyase/cysteine desulfurase